MEIVDKHAAMLSEVGVDFVDLIKKGLSTEGNGEMEVEKGEGEESR
jgi:hypothetical protein